MRVALYGGSFDPPHVAHLMAASWVLATRPVDRLLVVPCAHHAFDKELSPFELRMEMCSRTFPLLGEKVLLSRVEQEIGGASRTIDTLEELMAEEPDWSFRLVVGADILGEAHSWKAFEKLVRLAPLIVVGRAGHGSGQADGQGPLIELPDVSSTTIRERVARGLPIDHLVSRGTLELIEEHGLYR